MSRGGGDGVLLLQFMLMLMLMWLVGWSVVVVCYRCWGQMNEFGVTGH